MAFDYSDLIADAHDLITDFGRPVTARIASETLIDANQPSRGYVDSPVDTEVAAVFVNFTRAQLENTAIEEGDKRCFIPASDLTTALETKDRILDGATEYQIIAVREVAPGASAIVYDVHLR